MTRYQLTAAVGAALVAAGVALWDVPAGVVTAGIELISGTYAAAYLAAKGRPSP